MLNNRIRTFGLLVLVTATAVSVAVAQSKSPPPPPYIAHDAQHLLIGFEAEEAAIKELIPAGLEIDSNVLVANMYHVPRGFGITPWNRSYVWADLKGYDSVDGGKGRYVMIGWAEGDTFRKAAETFYWSANPGKTVWQKKGDEVTAVLTVDGKEIIRGKARLTGKTNPDAAGLLNYPYVKPNARPPIERSETGEHLIPFAGTVIEAEPVSLEFNVPAGHPLSKIRPKRLVWAAVVDGGNFSLGWMRDAK